MPEPQPAGQPPEPLFHESGASWYWLLGGPVAAAALMWVEHAGGYGVQLLAPLLLLVGVSGMLAIQIAAARVHTSVELTGMTLRDGTETIRLADVVWMYPESPQVRNRAAKPEKWQSARTLGELSGVPKGRVSIGLKLTGGRTAQAWARHHRGLRAALTPLVPTYPGADLAGPDDDAEAASW